MNLPCTVLVWIIMNKCRYIKCSIWNKIIRGRHFVVWLVAINLPNIFLTFSKPANYLFFKVSWLFTFFKMEFFWNCHCSWISCTIYQRPDHYTYQVSVYLPSISILIIILSILIFKYWYWYFLFQKRT